MRRFSGGGTVVLVGATALFGLLAHPLSVGAQCEGRARSATSSSGFNGCDPHPHLQWNFQVSCLDGCGEIWAVHPTASNQANGACTAFPQTTCIPVFEQLDHNSGLYAVTSAFDQTVFGGCQKTDLRFTEVNCQCAPSCGTQPVEEPDIDGEATTSPILVSLSGAGYRLSSPAEGVRFDIDADGLLERIAWTRGESDDAFLVLDRDGDGRITSGLELFGDATPQLPSPEANGFRALAVFDEPQNGGNADGRIDAADRIYRDLRLWLDEDHDGESDPGELRGLPEAGLASLDLEYHETGRRDLHGNEFRYRGRGVGSKGEQRIVWDVFFAHLED